MGNKLTAKKTRYSISGRTQDYLPFQDDDGSWYVNRYFYLINTECYETLYSSLTKGQAKNLADTMRAMIRFELGG